MRSCAAAALGLLVLLFGGVWLTAGEQADPLQPQETAAAADSGVYLQVWNGEQAVEMRLDEYLAGVVRGEMPAVFEQQALCAQAAAERTYVYYRMRGGRKATHPEADVCMDYRCCSAFVSREDAAVRWGGDAAEYEAKVQRAVADTDGQVILYDGAPILAAFHSSSAGVTANSGDVWVSTLPYLHSVSSPEGPDSVPNYYSVVNLPAAAFRDTFLAAHPEANFSGPVEGWIGGLTENDSGRVETAVVGGVTVEGTELRSLYGLRSACFTVEATAEQLTFHVTGYGHGVGMSQYGANLLASQGKTWREILQWYYSGVEIGPYALPS